MTALDAARRHIVIVAHQAEAFARQKRLKPIEKYLEKAGPRGRGASGAEMIAFFQSLRRRGAPVTIKRIGKPDGIR